MKKSIIMVLTVLLSLNIVLLQTNNHVNASKPSPAEFCGIDSKNFDRDTEDVVLDLFIGINENPLRNIDGVEVYIEHSNGKTILLNITDFETDTFEYETIEISFGRYSIDYTYSDTITIPSSFFEDDEGSVMIHISLYVVGLDNESVMTLGYGCSIEYKLNGDILELSSKSIYKNQSFLFIPNNINESIILSIVFIVSSIVISTVVDKAKIKKFFWIGYWITFLVILIILQII